MGSVSQVSWQPNTKKKSPLFSAAGQVAKHAVAMIAAVLVRACILHCHAHNRETWGGLSKLYIAARISAKAVHEGFSPKPCTAVLPKTTSLPVPVLLTLRFVIPPGDPEKHCDSQLVSSDLETIVRGWMVTASFLKKTNTTLKSRGFVHLQGKPPIA